MKENFTAVNERYPLSDCERGYPEKATKGRLVCDCSQCEIKGAIRTGSGQNFETHFCVDKIWGTATRYQVPFGIPFAACGGAQYALTAGNKIIVWQRQL